MDFSKTNINGSYYDLENQKKFNGCIYSITFYPYYSISAKSIRIYISIGSGKKRKEVLESSVQKFRKSVGGIGALIWYKECIRQFIQQSPKLVRHFKEKTTENVYIIIEWEDKRRRDIYTRYLKDLGFYSTHDKGSKCLKLKIK